MKFFGRVALWVLGSTGVLLASGWLASNLYIQSPGAHQKICAALSRSIGLPLSFFRISYAPWSGLVLTDVLVQEPGDPRVLLRAAQLRIRCSYLQIFRHELLVKQLALQQVNLNLPAAFAVEAHGPSSAAGPLPPHAAADLSLPAAAPGNGSRSRFRRSFLIQIQRFKLTDGTVNLLSRDGVPVATLRGLGFSVHLEGSRYLGKLQADGVTLGNSLDLEDLASPVQITDGRLALSSIEARVYSGQVSGNLLVDLSTPPYSYRLALQASGVNVSDLAPHLNELMDRAHGTLQASLDLRGATGEGNPMQGSGQLQIDSCYLDQYPLLQEIGRWTQVDELQRLQLDRAAAQFHVNGPVVAFESINLVSKNCQVALHGVIDAAQHVDLTGRLTINQFLSQKIPNELEENFIPNGDDHSRILDFKVVGPVSHPQTDLFDRIIGNKKKLFRRLLGGERHDKPREALPRPAPSDL
ncbi:MAG TPA: AsmA family protein [Chthoniobacterales bacterium]